MEPEVVAEALTALSKQHRQVLIECFFRGQDLTVAAQRLELPLGTVKARLTYALRSLRLALQERGVAA